MKTQKILSLVLALCVMMIGVIIIVDSADDQRKQKAYLLNPANHIYVLGELTTVTNLTYRRGGKGNSTIFGFQIVIRNQEGDVRKWEIWGFDGYQALEAVRAGGNGSLIQLDLVRQGSVVYQLIDPFRGKVLYKNPFTE